MDDTMYKLITRNKTLYNKNVTSMDVNSGAGSRVVYSGIRRNATERPLIEISTGNLPRVKDCRRVWLIFSPPLVNRLSIKYVSLDVSQPCVPPWPAAGIALYL
jgi:hypothetical protein